MKNLWLIPISLLMIAVSPFVLWNSASQNRADDFESAKEVELNSSEEGYIIVEGEASAEETLNCPSRNSESSSQCLYVSERVERYVRSEQEVCSASRPDNVIENLDTKCDADGNCTPCYLVEQFNWEEIESSVESVEFNVGDYSVSDFRSANKLGFETLEVVIENETETGSIEQSEIDDIAEFYLGEENDIEVDPYYEVFGETESEESVENNESESEAFEVKEQYIPETGDVRFNYVFLKNTEELVVAGEARRNEIYEGDKEFVISALSYGETLSRLESQDSSASFGLRVLSFGLMAFGFMFLFTSIAAIPLLLVKIIPFVGDKINNLANSLIGFIGFTIGSLIWGLFFVLITILKSPIVLGLIIIIAGGIGFRIWQNKNEIEKVSTDLKTKESENKKEETSKEDSEKKSK